MSATRHPVFARLYVRFAEAAERKGALEHRRTLLEGLTGRVVEIGAGHGPNFPHYPHGVEEVIAVEPEEHLRGLALRAAQRAAIPIRVVGGVAQGLPLPDASCDAAVASLVLCSVSSQEQVLREMHRVLRPGGQLRFYEHVLDDHSGFARFQRAADVVWPLVAGGCHTSRDTLGAIEAAGFGLERVRRFGFRPSVVALPATPHVLGVARRP